jgi:ubiquinone/menaquinone biosynthesis C-methylase UbiE
MKMLDALIASQLRAPNGLLGYLAGWWMNTFNQEMIASAVEKLGIGPHDRVLDIGFGGGITLQLLTQYANRGVVAGIDISDTMLRHAKISHACLIKQGRVELKRGSIESIPFDNHSFDRICTINTVYFWRDPMIAISEVHRVLKSGGVVVIAFRPREEMSNLKISRYGFTLYDAIIISDTLYKAGFTNIKVEQARDAHLRYLSIVATKH